MEFNMNKSIEEENKSIVTKIALECVPDFKLEHKAEYSEVWESLMKMAKYKDNYYNAMIEAMNNKVLEFAKKVDEYHNRIKFLEKEILFAKKGRDLHNELLTIFNTIKNKFRHLKGNLSYDTYFEDEDMSFFEENFISDELITPEMSVEEITEYVSKHIIENCIDHERVINMLRKALQEERD